MSASEYYLQGQQGGVALRATESATGPFREILVVNAAVLNALGEGNVTGSDTALTLITLPAGLRIGGKFSEIGVTSGVVIAYYE